MSAVRGSSVTRDYAVALRNIRALVAVLHGSARAVEHSTGVTNAQLFILRQLDSNHGLSINELGARALTGQNTVSTIVTRLEHRGLVRRRRATADGRRVVVSLTPAGRRLVQRALEPPTARLLAALVSMPPKRVAELGRSVQALIDELGASTRAAGMLFEQHANTTAHTTAAAWRGRTSRVRGSSAAPRSSQTRGRSRGGSP